MDIKLYNTLSLKKEIFNPIEKNKVGLYTCGPTVYDYAHIGNLRTYVFEDILKRVLKYNDYEVKHVMNITDVGHLTGDMDMGEDKLEKGAKREGKTAWEIAKFYTDVFLNDLQELNIEMPDEMPKATDYIKEQIEMISVLENKGYTYKTSDGIYFDTSKFENYNKLSHQNLKNLQEGARVEKNDEKTNATDFALWKFSPYYVKTSSGKPNEKRQMEWNSPWGVGFPGWHIECSAMSMAVLKDQLDIHCGGIDHINIHHTNEIAQSEAVTDKQFFNYWMHGEFLVIDKQKMAKSTGTFITLQTLKDDGYNPLVFRYLTFLTHYRKPLHFKIEALNSAQNAIDNLYGNIRGIISEENFNKNKGKINKEFKEKFLESINDDLNMPNALAIVFNLIRSGINNNDKYLTLLDFDKVLGLNLNKIEKVNIPKNLINLAEKRKLARLEKNWQESDNLRNQIKELGFEIEDMENDHGYILKEIKFIP